MIYSHRFIWIILPLFQLLYISCGSEKPKKELGDFEVVMRIPAEPTGLNSIVNRDAMKSIILPYIMYQPLSIDFEQLKLFPLLAHSLPEVETMADSSVKITLELRPEARWDNGSLITAEDVAFSLKLCLLPDIQNAAIKPGFQHLKSFITYPDAPQKYSLVFSKPYFLAPVLAGDFAIYPAYIYDTLSILKKFSIEQVISGDPLLQSDSALVQFSEAFNSALFTHQIVAGCGPYRLKEWQSGKRIILERKKNWWGDELEGSSVFFEAYPARIIFEIIKEESTAIQALKQKKIDGMASVDFKTFALTLAKDSALTAHYHFYSPEMLAFEYMGLNSRRPILQDLAVRRAILHAVSVEDIIATLMYGLGSRVHSYVSSARPEELNTALHNPKFDIAYAAQILDSAGWVDRNGDGIREKKTGNKETALRLQLLINSDNERREKTALMLQSNLREAGIDVSVKTLEMNAYVDALMRNDFDLVLTGIVSSAIETDPFQLWHSASKGGNFTGFGNTYSDSLIMAFRNEMSPHKRIEISKQIQAEIHAYHSVLFLNNMHERIVFSKKFKNLTLSKQRPGFWLGSVLPAE